jgi:hypothetical protein
MQTARKTARFVGWRFFSGAQITCPKSRGHLAGARRSGSLD